METTEEWTRGSGTPLVVKKLVWYTDGARTRGWEVFRAGVCGQFSAGMLNISLGKYATLFQTEILAVLAFIHSVFCLTTGPKPLPKTVPPHSVIQSFLFQMRVSFPVFKVIQ
jgi:hypothetical protein